jgi:hypothetical protein
VAPSDGAIEGSYRCSGSARQWRRTPLDLAKTNGVIRSGRRSGFQREWSREGRERDDDNLHHGSRKALAQDRALPGEGGLDASAVALGGVAGVLGGANEGEDVRERGRGVFIWRDGLGDRRGWSWRSGLALAKLGGGVSVLGLGVRGARGFGGTWCPGVPRRACRPCGQVRARRCSTVAAASNGREGMGGCASGLLGWCGVGVRERVDRGRAWGKEQGRV